MKNVRKVCTIVTLMSVFAVYASAGEMNSPGQKRVATDTTITQPATITEEEEFSSTETAEVTLTEVIMNSIKTALSIF